WLFANGQTGAAIGMAIYGALLVSSIDNVLRPLLISRSPQRIHFLVVLFGVLGGLAAFGPLGLFVGPVLLSVTLALVAEFSRRGAPGPPGRWRGRRGASRSLDRTARLAPREAAGGACAPRARLARSARDRAGGHMPRVELGTRARFRFAAALRQARRVRRRSASSLTSGLRSGRGAVTTRRRRAGRARRARARAAARRRGRPGPRGRSS